MPYPFLRHNERRNAPPGRENRRGIRLVHPDGTVFFFPGATPALAMVLAQMGTRPEYLTHPATVIEFGEKIPGGWITERVLKAPPKTPKAAGGDNGTNT